MTHLEALPSDLCIHSLSATLCHNDAGPGVHDHDEMSICHAGLELFFIDAPGAAAGGGPTWGASSAFFTFGKEEERERAAAVLTGQPALGSSLPGGRRAAAAAGSILEACFGPWFASFCISKVA